MAEKKTRSSRYQAVFHEKFFSNEMLEIFSNEESISKRLDPYSYNETVLDLEDRLRAQFWKLLEEHLTPRQREIVNLLKQGATQQEAAKILGVNQSSITKSLNGNVDYSDGSERRSYGGIVRKMAKIVENSPEIKEILQQIADLRGENWL